MLKLKPL
jgi:ATP-dependent helicase STH1/SNF2